VADENMGGTVEPESDEQVADDADEPGKRQYRLAEEWLQELSAHRLVKERTHAVESPDFNDCQNRQYEQRKCHEQPLDDVGPGNLTAARSSRVVDFDYAAHDVSLRVAHAEAHHDPVVECPVLVIVVHRLEYCHDDDGYHAHLIRMVLEPCRQKVGDRDRFK